jgi:DNA-binding MarR family transcriptional regulator
MAFHLKLLRVLWALDHALQARSKAMTRKLKVTGPQRFFLRQVELQPGISLGELAAMLHLHPSTITGVVSRLETRGWVKRIADPADRRRARLSLTRAGKAVLLKKRNTIEDVISRALARQRPSELATAVKVLQRITEALMEAPPP